MRMTIARVLSRRVPTPHLCDDELPIVPPPSTLTVEDTRQPVLYTADGHPLVRRAGF
jgi:hypothetical protein